MCDNCSLSGPLPDAWYLPALSNLVLPNNYLSGVVAPIMPGLPSLQELSMQSNLLSGALGDTWPASIQELNVMDNAGISGTLPASALCNGLCSAAVVMNLAAIQSTLSSTHSHTKHTLTPNQGLLSTSIIELFIANTNLSGPLPPANGPALSPFGIVDFSGNPHLTGPIPSSWAAWLRNVGCGLRLEQTGLCGAVPDGLPCFDKSGTNLGACCGVIVG
jgi:hypothetical protein